MLGGMTVALSAHWWNEYFPAWLEAFSTALGFIAAAAAAVYAARVYGREAEREKRIEDAQRKEQASLVSGWVGSKEIMEPVQGGAIALGVGGGGQRMRIRNGLYLRNASQLPVFDVTTALIYEGERFELPPVAVIPPSSEPIFHELLAKAPDDWDGTGGLQVGFRDTSGVEWLRLRDGRLIEKVDGYAWAGISLS